jgi:hypothetical protein
MIKRKKACNSGLFIAALRIAVHIGKLQAVYIPTLNKFLAFQPTVAATTASKRARIFINFIYEKDSL